MNEVLEQLKAKYPDHDFHVDPDTGMIGFVFEDMYITDPWISECGRFTVDPQTYGLTIPSAVALKAHNLPLELAEQQESAQENFGHDGIKA